MIIFDDNKIQQNDFTAVTLGNFDGIHLGHQKLIETVKALADKNNFLSVVFSFYPHPASVIKKNKSFYTILSPKEKAFVLQSMGIDVLIQYPFTKEFADLKPDEFIDIIFNTVNCKILVVGEDYCFGKNRCGTYNTLKAAGLRKGIDVIKISHVNIGGSRVSSTRIRNCILSGYIVEANELLNRPYFIMGTVVEGKKIGRTIGFPTLNLIAPDDKILPPDGVYITKTDYNGRIYESITNIGKNPTVNGQFRTVETHLFDFDKEIYGDSIIVYFYDWIRGEQAFNNIDELKNQIASDKCFAVDSFYKFTDNI